MSSPVPLLFGCAPKGSLATPGDPRVPRLEHVEILDKDRLFSPPNSMVPIRNGAAVLDSRGFKTGIATDVIFYFDDGLERFKANGFVNPPDERLQGAKSKRIYLPASIRNLAQPGRSRQSDRS